MKETVLEKLKVLAESAKYDVSCASSGVKAARGMSLLRRLMQ